MQNFFPAFYQVAGNKTLPGRIKFSIYRKVCPQRLIEAKNLLLLKTTGWNTPYVV